MFFHRNFNELVELPGADSLVGLFKEHLRMVEQCLDVFARLTSNKADRAIGHRGKSFADVSDPTFRWELTRQLVPFVDDKHAWFEIVAYVVRELFVDLTHLLLAVEKQQNDVSSSNTSLRPV